MIHLSGGHLDVLWHGLLGLITLTFYVGLKRVRIKVIEVPCIPAVRLEVDQWLIISTDFSWMLLLLLDYSLVVVHLGQLIIRVLLKPLDRRARLAVPGQPE